MKKIIILLSFAAMALGFHACAEDETNSDVIPADQLYLPRNDYPVDTSKGQAVKFEWKTSKTGNNSSVKYELLFDIGNGNFSEPVYIIPSSNNGYSPEAEISAATLKTIISRIASRTGANTGDIITIRWTVRALSGTASAVYSGTNGIRTLQALVPNPTPNTVAMEGSSTENQESISLFAANVLHTAKGTYRDERQEGAFECYTQLAEGEFNIVDDYGRYYYLGESNTIYKSDVETEPTPTTIAGTDAGIYWVYMNFNSMTYKLQKIAKVEFYLANGESKKNLSYEGGGIWAVEDYAWNYKTGGTSDSRHKFICTFADNSTEYWGHYEDDCRSSATPETEKPALFYNIFRHATSVGSWDNTWKVNENVKEGFGMNAAFRLHMNNTDASLFLLERSFVLVGDALPTSVSMQGAAAEGTTALSAASILQTAKGTYTDQRQTGAFECYTKLVAGQFTITDNYNRYVSLGSGGTFTTSGTSVSNTVSDAGVYWICLDFVSKTYTMKKISKVELWLVNPGTKTELTYKNNGIWSIEDLAWNYKTGGTSDSRHKFICTFADSSVEYWGHYEDDCRHAADATKPALFYNIFRHTTSVGQWDNTWKVNESANEGFGMLATFTLNMNNTAATLYLLQRSFRFSGTLPASVTIQGSAATENGNNVSLFAASLLHTSTANVTSDDRESGAFECYTRLTAGNITITDNESRYVSLVSGGSMTFSGTAVSNTVAAGIYRIYLNFNSMTWTMKEITKVQVWNGPWFGGGGTQDLTYQGNGVWKVSDYAWNIGNASQKDSRYNFRATYADATVERWAYRIDDCNEHNNIAGTPLFYNVFRFDDSKMSNNWNHSWKTVGDNEGYNQKATFTIYMNNTQDAACTHTRSFSN